jgi:hypothetical protein
MNDMENLAVLESVRERIGPPPGASIEPRRRSGLGRMIRGAARGLASGAEWLFGLFSLVVGLSVLAAWPIAQLLTLGYFLESSARVAQGGQLRDGLIGVRRAARVGGVLLGGVLGMVPMWFVGSYAYSAEIIDPGGPVAHRWRAALVVVTALTLVHLLTACARGGRLRHFLWPVGMPFWLRRKLKTGRGFRGLYADSRDGFWEFLATLNLPHYFRLGFFGFVGTMAWIVVPAGLIAASGRYPVLGFLGGILLAFLAPSIPFLQVRYAVEGRFRSLFSLRSVRERFRRAPWAFAFALLVLVVASVPLYLLKIEMIPREAAWLPSLVFVLFLAPAHLLVGWAYARSFRRYRPRHWLVRAVGRLAIIPVALFYVLIVVIAQYTSWGGIWSVYEQHAFLVPVPFLNM